MHAHLAAVFEQLDHARAVLEEAVRSVPGHLHRTRPAPGRWSVAEVLEHLVLVDRFFAERIAGAIHEARAAGLGPETGARNPLPPDVAAAITDRTDRRAARDAMMPTGRLDTAAAWDALDRARDEVRTAVAPADGLALSTVKADHRLFGPLDVYQWVELTAAHEIRHAHQIREAGQTLRTQESGVRIQDSGLLIPDS